MISRYETSLHSFSFRWSHHIPNSTENPKQPEIKPSLSTMPTGEPLDKDDREADALIESLEHQIADITELNEPMVTWDVLDLYEGVGGLVQPADETVVGDGEVKGEA